MKTAIIMFAIKSPAISSSMEYFAGVVIALFILAYLIFALIKPEQF